jgi:hypothetical protein
MLGLPVAVFGCPSRALGGSAAGSSAGAEADAGTDEGGGGKSTAAS